MKLLQVKNGKTLNRTITKAKGELPPSNFLLAASPPPHFVCGTLLIFTTMAFTICVFVGADTWEEKERIFVQ